MSVALYIYADFMHFVLFVENIPDIVLVWIGILEIYTATQCFLVGVCSWFSLAAQGSAHGNVSWVVQLFYVIIDDILVIGICDGTYNMFVYRRTKGQMWPTIGLPRLTHRTFIWVRPQTPYCGVCFFFVPSCHDGSHLSWKGVQQTT